LSTFADRLRQVPAIARRALHRMGVRSRRTAHALVQSGPGRIPGAVLHAEWDGLKISIGGWAHTRSHDIAAVVLHVDGVARGVAAYGLQTPEITPGVPATRRPAAGWAGDVYMPAVTRGQHLIEATVVQRNGLADRIGGVIAARPAQGAFPLGFVDWPGDGAVIEPPLAHVGGWIRHDEGYTRIEVSFDADPDRGVTAGPVQRARILGQHRPDLAKLLNEPLATLAGWDAWVLTPDVERPTEVTLRVEAFKGAEPHFMASRRVTITPAERIEPERDRLQLLSSRVQLAGRAAAGSSRPVTVLVATHQLGLGGGQLYLHELLRHLPREGDIRCHVFSQADGCLRDDLESWGAHVHIVGAPPIDGLGYEAKMLELVTLAATLQPGVVIANTAGSFWGVDLAQRLGIPSIWAIHESFTPDHFLAIGFPGRPDRHVAGKFRQAFSDAAATIYEAGPTRDLFEGLTPAGRALRLDYGIDLERIDAFTERTDRAKLRREQNLGDGDLAIVCVGTLEPRKAQGVLSAAFAAIADDFPQAQLFLVGDSPSDFSNGLHALVDRLGLAGRVHLIPVTPQIDDWYLLADAFVLSSDIESLPMSVLEAMAFGVPVVASAIFGLPELIDHGHNGFLFRPGDLAETTTALRTVLNLSPDERARVGRTARELVHATRDSRRYAASYRRLIDQLVRQPDILPRPALATLPDGAAHD
jgi:D-inositol-3-phosphate glycosyltransferase